MPISTWPVRVITNWGRVPVKKTALGHLVEHHPSTGLEQDNLGLAAWYAQLLEAGLSIVPGVDPDHHVGYLLGPWFLAGWMLSLSGDVSYRLKIRL